MHPGINAEHVQIGRGVELGSDVKIGAIGGPAQRVVIGDHVRIGDNVRILVPELEIGDYTTIHQNVTANGFAPLRIGSCCWIGQNCFLNASGPLTLDDGVIISTYSSVWTHLSGGDPLQGFQFVREGVACLGADCYIGPQCVVSPVNVGANSMLLGGSVLTKDLPENRVYGGNPAADLTDKLGAPYRDVALEQRYATLCRVLHDFASGVPRDVNTFVPKNEPTTPLPDQSCVSAGSITVTMTDLPENGHSIFDVRNRAYSKLGTPEEVAFMRYLLPHIKFYPRARP